MDFLRNHWVDIGGIVAVIILVFLFLYQRNISPLRIILLLSFISLLLHQIEEYRFPGNFPLILNKNVFHSKTPRSYPLNTQSAFIINVFLGWVIYILAIFLADTFIWIAIVSFMVSIGNILVHTFVFNIKGKTFYNPGMITALVLFLPITIWFFVFVTVHGLANPSDYYIGVPLGILCNYLGVLKTIDWLKNKKTTYVFNNT